MITLCMVAALVGTWPEHVPSAPTLQRIEVSATAVQVALAAPEWKKRLKEIKRLYLRARYEEILPLLDKLEKQKLTTEQRLTVLRYEAFVLYLLKMHTQAADAWRELLAVDPAYELSPDDASPEFIAFFGRIEPEVFKPAEPKPASPEPGPDPAAPADSNPTPLPERAPPPEVPTSPPAESSPAPEVSPTEVVEAQPAATATLELPPPALEAELPERGCGIVLCLIPGGVGQYANGQILKGVLFSVVEAGALATNIAMYWGPDIGNPDLQLGVQRAAMITAIAAAVLGIVDAFLFY